MRDRLGIDFRALAAFRVALGLIVAGVCAGRFPHLAAHFSAGGLFPAAVRLGDLAGTGSQGIWSLCFLGDTPAWNGFLLALGVLSGLALALGWRCRLATVLCWALAGSLYAPTPATPTPGTAETPCSGCCSSGRSSCPWEGAGRWMPGIAAAFDRDIGQGSRARSQAGRRNNPRFPQQKDQRRSAVRPISCRPRLQLGDPAWR